MFKLFFLEPSYRCRLNCESGELHIFSDSHVKKGQELKQFKNKDGYLTYKLFRKTVFVHRIVAEKTIGKIPEGLVANHKDGNKTNNSPKNLEYVTIAENVKHSVDNGMHICNYPERSGRYVHGKTIGGKKKLNAYKLEWYHKNKKKNI